MRMSLNRFISLIAIMIISVAYSIYLGANVDEIVLVAIVLLIMPAITFGLMFVKKGIERKIALIVLLVITVIMILLAGVILFFTGTFSDTGAFSFKTIGMVGLVLSPLFISYIYLAYIQFMEINSKYNGRRRNLF